MRYTVHTAERVLCDINNPESEFNIGEIICYEGQLFIIEKKIHDLITINNEINIRKCILYVDKVA